jgi:hypothetical protein
MCGQSVSQSVTLSIVRFIVAKLHAYDEVLTEIIMPAYACRSNDRCLFFVLHVLLLLCIGCDYAAAAGDLVPTDMCEYLLLCR